MGYLNDTMFATIDERLSANPRGDVWPKPHKPRPVTDDERKARVKKALEAERPEPATFGDAAAADFFADWVLVRVGDLATYVLHEHFFYRNSNELFPAWEGPDGGLYANPMSTYLREKVLREQREGEHIRDTVSRVLASPRR